MNVLVVNAAPSGDVNAAYITDKLMVKYAGCGLINVCSLRFEPDMRLTRNDGGFRPGAVEEGLLDAMSMVAEADLVIMIAPSYFGFISGAAKMFLDRFIVFQNFSGRPTFGNNKKLFFLLTQASANRAHGQSAVDWMKNFAAMFDMKFFGMVVPNCTGKEPEGAKVKMDEISMSLNMFG